MCNALNCEGFILILCEEYSYLCFIKLTHVLLQLVRLLVDSGADIHFRNKGGKTPCDVAAPGLIPHLLTSHSLGEFIQKIQMFYKSTISCTVLTQQNTKIRESLLK